MLLLLFLSQNAFGEIVTDLNGFRLWQYKTAVEASYGEPNQKIEQKDSTYEVFYLPKHAYMVFEYLKIRQHNIFSIQITGSAIKMIPFKGLVLGDSVEKVKKNLGEPSNISKLKKPRVDIYGYDNTNYSIEINENGKLYSIRIHVNDDLFEKASFTDEHWENFKNAVINKDVQKIISWLRPDVEIYKDNKVLSINKKMSEFKKNPNQEFIQAIIADKNSIFAELKKTEPEGEMRLQENMGVASVYKFYEGDILSEIVFFPYNGKYRIYEITFKEKK